MHPAMWALGFFFLNNLRCSRRLFLPISSVTFCFYLVCILYRAQQRPWGGRHNSGSEDGGDGAGGVDACWAAPPTASLGDALAAALAKAGTQSGENGKKKVPMASLID
jgi:hypothetical protein